MKRYDGKNNVNLRLRNRLIRGPYKHAKPKSINQPVLIIIRTNLSKKAIEFGNLENRWQDHPLECVAIEKYKRFAICAPCNDVFVSL